MASVDDVDISWTEPYLPEAMCKNNKAMHVFIRHLLRMGNWHVYGICLKAFFHTWRRIYLEAWSTLAMYTLIHNKKVYLQYSIRTSRNCVYGIWQYKIYSITTASWEQTNFKSISKIYIQKHKPPKNNGKKTHLHYTKLTARLSFNMCWEHHAGVKCQQIPMWVNYRVFFMGSPF